MQGEHAQRAHHRVRLARADADTAALVGKRVIPSRNFKAPLALVDIEGTFSNNERLRVADRVVRVTR